MIEVSEIVLHEAYEPYVVRDLLDADLLAGGGIAANGTLRWTTEAHVVEMPPTRETTDVRRKKKKKKRSGSKNQNPSQGGFVAIVWKSRDTF